MPPPCCHHFSGAGASVSAASAAVEADAAARSVVDDRAIVDVVDDGGVHVGHRAVIEIFAASPIAAKEAHAGVSEAVVDSAIEPNHRTPVADVPHIDPANPTPIPRGPQKSNFRREHPGAGNPVVTIVTVGPVAWGPDVAWSWAKWLFINGENGRSNGNRDSHAHIAIRACLNRGRINHCGNHQQQRTDQRGDTHRTHLSGVGWAIFVNSVRPVATWSRPDSRTLEGALSCRENCNPFVRNKITWQ